MPRGDSGSAMLDPAKGCEAYTDVDVSSHGDDAAALASMLDYLLEHESLMMAVGRLDAQTLYEACKGFGTDDTVLIRQLATRGERFLNRVSLMYRDAHGEPLQKLVDEECGGWYAYLAKFLVVQEAQADTLLLDLAMKVTTPAPQAPQAPHPEPHPHPQPHLHPEPHPNPHPSPPSLTLPSPPPARPRDAGLRLRQERSHRVPLRAPPARRAAKAAWEGKNDVAVDRLNDELSGDMRKIAITLLKGKRTVDEDEAVDDARVRQLGDALHANASSAIDILCSNSPAMNKAISHYYEDTYDQSLGRALGKEFSGNVKTALLALVQDPTDFYAGRLKAAFKGFGTSDRTVCRIVGAHDKREIKEIAAAYERKYQTLKKDIADECSGNYKRRRCRAPEHRPRPGLGRRVERVHACSAPRAPYPHAPPCPFTPPPTAPRVPLTPAGLAIRGSTCPISSSSRSPRSSCRARRTCPTPCRRRARGGSTRQIWRGLGPRRRRRRRRDAGRPAEADVAAVQGDHPQVAAQAGGGDGGEQRSKVETYRQLLVMYPPLPMGHQILADYMVALEAEFVDGSKGMVQEWLDSLDEAPFEAEGTTKAMFDEWNNTSEELLADGLIKIKDLNKAWGLEKEPAVAIGQQVYDEPPPPPPTLVKPIMQTPVYQQPYAPVPLPVQPQMQTMQATVPYGAFGGGQMQVQTPAGLMNVSTVRAAGPHEPTRSQRLSRAPSCAHACTQRRPPAADGPRAGYAVHLLVPMTAVAPPPQQYAPMPPTTYGVGPSPYGHYGFGAAGW